MSKIVVYTHWPAAAKITFELDETKVSLQPLGGGDGVPPGMTLSEDNQVLLWIAAQDFGVVVVNDDRLVSVEPA